MTKPIWGLLPDAVIEQLLRREWEHPSHLRGRISGSRSFPIRLSLKPPTATQAMANLDHFRHFIQSWQAWPHPGQVQWQHKSWQRLGRQNVPVALQIDSMSELISVLGPKARARSRRWQQLMQPLLEVDPRLSSVLIRHLTALEEMSCDDTRLLAQLLPQLGPGIGQGNYLRALPLREVDTKFVEVHHRLITDCLDLLHEGAVTAQGGLISWLECLDTPAGWLMVRPLCRRTREGLAGLPLLQLDLETLIRFPLPASHILVVENKQSGYALPHLEDTIAVFGGGRNTAWMKAEWLRHKHLGYWGDIDSWGLAFLSDARSHQPHLHALMMDETTVLQHLPRMVEEKNSHPSLPHHLTAAEQQLFLDLQNGRFEKNRLEQERLASDYILDSLTRWHGLF